MLCSRELMSILEKERCAFATFDVLSDETVRQVCVLFVVCSVLCFLLCLLCVSNKQTKQTTKQTKHAAFENTEWLAELATVVCSFAVCGGYHCCQTTGLVFVLFVCSFCLLVLFCWLVVLFWLLFVLFCVVCSCVCVNSTKVENYPKFCLATANNN